MGKKYECDLCNFLTGRLFNYNSHLSSKKHINNATKIAVFVAPKNENFERQIESSSPKNETRAGIIQCEYCKKEISAKRNLNRHYKVCKEKRKHDREKQKQDLENEKNDLIKKLEEELSKEKKESLKKEELCQQKEEELLKEKTSKEEIEEKYKEILEQIVKGKISNGKVINNINMIYVQNNFKDAHNFEDLMNEPLTQDEIDNILKYGPMAGCLDLITTRCVDNIDAKKRPLHCVDSSRNKYLLKTDDKWKVDDHGKAILKKSFPKIRELYLLDADEIREASHKEILKFNENMMSLYEMEKKGHIKIIKVLNDKVLLKNIDA